MKILLVEDDDRIAGALAEALTDQHYVVDVQWMCIPLDELLEDVVEFFKPQAEARGITLKSEISKEVFIKGDAIQLKRLFSNLLQNALKYTIVGGKVTVSIVNHERFVIISIEDSGIGIAPEHIPLIFNRFWRADQARSRLDEGLGLGLAIADAIAQTHG